MFYSLYIVKMKTIFSSETIYIYIRLRALIFGMLHHLADLFQVCSKILNSPRDDVKYKNNLKFKKDAI